MNQARNLKFGSEMDDSEYYRNEKCKIRSMGSRGGHVTHFLIEFWNRPNISGMDQARNFKIGSEMVDSEY